MREKIESFVESHREETLALLKELASIPAPSGKEESRAQYVLAWLESYGAEGAFLDEAGNVVFLYGKKDAPALTVVSAHMDTVCPSEELILIEESETCLCGAGVRDDTANLVNLMMGIRYCLEQQLVPEQPLLFAAVVGEEGLGNLKGSKEIWRIYGSRIQRWISYDLNYDTLYNRAVGSQRYRISIQTEGGHSYKDFGNENAIVQLAKLLLDLYAIPVATEPKVTYNVGKMEGGTTVNSIAQNASMLYEFRSDSQKALRKMEENLERILEAHRNAGEAVSCEIVGIRPGNGELPEEKQEALEELCRSVIQKYYDGAVEKKPGSTDCNIPLSHGIPAVCIGTAMGEGTHTPYETVEKESLVIGQKIAIDLICCFLTFDEYML